MVTDPILAEDIPELVHKMPKTFQIFASLCKDAEKLAKNYKNYNSVDMKQNLPSRLIQSDEFTALIEVIGELELSILRVLYQRGRSNSTELAGMLDVSPETIKRKYKILLLHSLIRACPRRGCELTKKGIRFVRMFEEKSKTVSLDTKNDDTNSAIETIDANKTYKIWDDLNS